MNRIQRYASWYLLALVGVTAIIHLRMVWVGGAIWSPLDEQAHYDYIDRLSSGQLPSPADRISSYTESITAEYFEFPEVGDESDPARPDTVGRSYEAIQFPLYYALLAAPNWVLKQLGTPPPTQIRLLRSINVVFHLAAAMLAIGVFRGLSGVLGINPLFGYFVAYLMASVRLLYRYHLSPDQITPLLGAVFVYLLVRLWRTRNGSYLGWSALVASVTFLTRPASGMLFLVWLLSALVFYRRSGPFRWRSGLWHVAPLLLAPAWIIVGGRVPGLPDLPTRAVAQAMGGLIEPRLIALDVLAVLGRQSLDWAPVWTPRAGIALLAIAVICGNYALSFYRWFVQRERSAAPFFIACQVSGLLLLAVLMLNAYVESAVWYHFRHWEAYSMFWYTAMLATPLLFDWKWLRVSAAAAGAALATLMTFLWL